MAKFVHIIYVVIISVLAILLWQESSQEVSDLNANESLVNTSLNHRVDENERNLEALVGELQAQNQSLEARVQEQERLLADLRDQAGEIAEQERNQQEAAGEQSEQTRNSVNALARAIENAQDGHLSNDDMAVRRELEPVDPSWAYPIEQNLQDFFIREEEFRHINVIDLECRTSYCEMSLELTEPGQSFNTSVLNRYLQEEDWFQNGMIMAFENPEAGTATVIIETRRKVD